MWVIARLVHMRGRNVERLQEQTAALRDARDDRARMEVAMDRARLSADLDELLQRRLGELATLAERGASQEGAEATATLLEIEHGSRRTLEEMRAVVGVLRSADETDAVAPQPTLTHLEAMLLRAKGAEARLTVDGSPRALPAGVELSRLPDRRAPPRRARRRARRQRHRGLRAATRSTSRSPGPPRAAASPRPRSSAPASARRCTAARSQAETRGGRAEAIAHLPIAMA